MDEDQKVRHYLQVPYNEKELAKDHGAKWNSKRKQWYMPGYFVDSNDLAKWFSFEEDFILFAEIFYLAKSKQLCWKCHRKTFIYAVLFYNYEYNSNPGDYIEIAGREVDIGAWYYDSDPFFCNLSELNNESINKLTKIKDSIIEPFVSIARRQNGQQYCDHCKAKQGNYYLFDEVDSPFAFIDPELLYKVDLYKLNVFVKSNASPSYSSLEGKDTFIKNAIIKTLK